MFNIQTVASQLLLGRLRTIRAGLAVLTLILAVGWGGWDTATAERPAKQLRYLATHPNASDDELVIESIPSGVGERDEVLVALLSINRVTPENAVIGFPRSGRFWFLFWELLYPRRVVAVDSVEAFERERPTHLLLDGAFPPYTFPGDPRSQPGQQNSESWRVIQVRPAEPVPPHSLLHDMARLVAAIVEGLAPLALGWLLILIILPRWSRGWPAWLALAFLLGIGAHTLLLFGLSLIGVPLRSPIVLTVDLVLIVMGVIAASHYRRPFRSVMPDRAPEPFGKRHVALLTVLGVLILIHLFLNLSWPVTHFDAVTSYDYRARAIAQQGTVAIWQFFDNPGRVNFYYPFFITMLHAHHYLLGGLHPKVYHTLMLVSFLVVFYSWLRARGSSAFQGLVFTTALAGNSGVMTLSLDATLNFPQMVYATIGLFFVLEYVARQESSDLLLAGLCLGLTGWIRTDSVVILAVACTVVLLAGRLPWRARLRGAGVLIGCYVLLALPYEYFMRLVVHHDAVTYYRISAWSLFDLTKLRRVLSFFVQHSMSSQAGYLALPWLLVVLADWPWRREARPLLLATGLMIVGWIGLFLLIGSADWTEIMGMSAVRWYINLIPLYLVSIAETDLIRQAFDFLETRTRLRLRIAL